jgi:hypothetical protein
VRDGSEWEPLVQKCAEYLQVLEKVGRVVSVYLYSFMEHIRLPSKSSFQERCFLSEEKHKLPSLMKQIFYGLNNQGSLKSKTNRHNQKKIVDKAKFIHKLL